MATTSLKAAVTGNIPVGKERSPYEHLKYQLETSKHEFKPLLGTDTNVDRFIRIVLNACLATPDLLAADRRSLIAASMKAAQDGLMPDGREAVLNIYNTNVARKGQPADWRKMAQYLPMVGGLIKKLYESGEVTYMDAAAVYANDKFTFRRGDDPKLEHEPTMDNDPGEIVAAYTVIKLKNGEIKREVMPRRDIEAVRGASKSKDSGPWATWYDQQAIKSVIKRAYKQLPKVDALERIIANDNEAMGFATTSGIGEITGIGNGLANSLENTAPVNELAPDIIDESVVDLKIAAQTLRESGAGNALISTLAKINLCTNTDDMDLIIDEIRFIDNQEYQAQLFEVAKQHRIKFEK